MRNELHLSTLFWQLCQNELSSRGLLANIRVLFDGFIKSQTIHLPSNFPCIIFAIMCLGKSSSNYNTILNKI